MPTIQTANKTYFDVLRERFEQASDDELIVIGDHRWSVAEFTDEVLRLAKGLTDLGLRPGSTVMSLLPTGIDAMASFFAMSLLGCVFVPSSVRFKADEAAYILGDAQVDAIVLTSELEERVPMATLVREVFAKNPELRPPLVVDLSRRPVSPSQRPPWLNDRSAIDDAGEGLTPDWRPGGPVPLPVTLLYSSGTTAAPKGVVLTESQMVAKSTAWALDFAELSPGDRLWNPLPFFHVGGISVLLAAFIARATYLADVFFQAEAALEQIERERATFLWPGFTTILHDLVRSPRIAKTDLSRVRAIGAAGPAGTLIELQKHFPGIPLVTVYGTTETGGLVTVTRRDDVPGSRLGTVGRPLPGLEVRIDRSGGRETSTGGPVTAGEIQVRGYSVCRNYYRKPEQTAELLAGDGWLRTGDLGWLDDEGWMHFVGRLKDIVRVGGENVSAAELEDVLNQHEAVVLAQVISVPHQRLGEVPVAFVELVAGAAPSEDDLVEHCRARLARYKVPRRVIAVTEWPMSSTKVQKFRLRELLPDFLADALAAKRQVQTVSIPPARPLLDRIFRTVPQRGERRRAPV